MKNLASLACGIVFGAGLAISGMTDTAKVIGFLDIFGDWMPDLMFVMGGAVLVTLLSFRFVLKRTAPVICDTFELPTNKNLDPKLISGAALFGIGWGIYGYCPGPAIASLAYLHIESILFVVSMTVGMAIVHFLTAIKNKN
ncbi:MAG: YeeE/YedE family protein [Cellvibrionaceae bacterium]